MKVSDRTGIRFSVELTADEFLSLFIGGGRVYDSESGVEIRMTDKERMALYDSVLNRE